MNTPWKTIRVFISSTFRDMQAERDHLVRLVFPRLRERLLPHRVHLADVDLRWGVTSDQNASQVCLTVINECQPWFIGLLAGRYGYVPDGSERSITEDEIQYGVLNRVADGHRSYFYFRDVSATLSITDPDYHEPVGSVAAIRLQNLKETILAAGFEPRTYSCRWDVNLGRLTGLEEFGRQVESDLYQAIATELSGSESIGSAQDRTEEEVLWHEQEIERHEFGFIPGSREAPIRQLIEHACNDTR